MFLAKSIWLFIGQTFFDVHHSLVQVCGHEPKVMPPRDSSLLVEAASLKEVARLCALSTVPGVEVSCHPAHLMQLCTSARAWCSVEIFSATLRRSYRKMKGEGGIATRRFQKKVDIRILTPTLSLLTFSRPVLPKDRFVHDTGF